MTEPLIDAPTESTESPEVTAPIEDTAPTEAPRDERAAAPTGPPPPGDAPGDGDAEASGGLSWPARGLALVGWAVVVIGALGAFDKIKHFAFAVPWMRLGMWLVYSTLFHDLLIAPVVTVVGLGVGYLLPRRFRGPVAGGLIVSAALIAISYPRLRGYGLLPDNPSVLPGNAARDLLVVLGIVWLIVAAVIVVGLVRDRSVARA